MAITKKSGNAIEVEGGLVLTPVEAVPERPKVPGPGRDISAQNRALIDTLKANPGTTFHVDVRKSAQPSGTLRAHGVMEQFRRREDGEGFDRYASYVGLENIPKPRPRGPRRKPANENGNGTTHEA